MTEGCAYCGKAFDDARRRTRDHVIPKALGGSRSANNIVPACLDCNQLKGSHTPASLRALAGDALTFAVRCAHMADDVERIMAQRGLSIGGKYG